VEEREKRRLVKVRKKRPTRLGKRPSLKLVRSGASRGEITIVGDGKKVWSWNSKESRGKSKLVKRKEIRTKKIRLEGASGGTAQNLQTPEIRKEKKKGLISGREGIARKSNLEFTAPERAQDHTYTLHSVKTGTD